MKMKIRTQVVMTVGMRRLSTMIKLTHPRQSMRQLEMYSSKSQQTTWLTSMQTRRIGCQMNQMLMKAEVWGSTWTSTQDMSSQPVMLLRHGWNGTVNKLVIVV